MRRELRLPLTAQGRLDRALADALGVGRAVVKAAFAAGEVRVRGRRAHASDPASPGALVELEVAEPAGPPSPEPEVPLTVLAEGPRWLVADKPPGRPTHPLAAEEEGTLANAVVARYPECAAASPDPREGGAVQRLDLETSGCVLFARDPEAWEALRAQFHARTIEKVYRALVVGRLPAGGVCSVSLAQRGGRVVAVPDPLAPSAQRRGQARPREAETHYEVERAFAAHTLLRVRIVTGVMHQIRAHLAFLGYPVLGDGAYGGVAAEMPLTTRHYLHAGLVGFARPGDGVRQVVESPLPRDFEAMLERLAAKGR